MPGRQQHQDFALPVHPGELRVHGIEGVAVQGLVEGQDVGGKGLEGGGAFLLLNLGFQVRRGLVQGIVRHREPVGAGQAQGRGGVNRAPEVGFPLPRPVGKAPGVGLEAQDALHPAVQIFVGFGQGHPGHQPFLNGAPEGRQGQDPGTGLFHAAVGVIEEVVNRLGHAQKGRSGHGQDGLDLLRVNLPGRLAGQVSGERDLDLGGPGQGTEPHLGVPDLAGVDPQLEFHRVGAPLEFAGKTGPGRPAGGGLAGDLEL